MAGGEVLQQHQQQAAVAVLDDGRRGGVGARDGRDALHLPLLDHLLVGLVLLLLVIQSLVRKQLVACNDAHLRLTERGEQEQCIACGNQKFPLTLLIITKKI